LESWKGFNAPHNQDAACGAYGEPQANHALTLKPVQSGGKSEAFAGIIQKMLA